MAPYIALFSWPLVVLVLARKLSPPLAFILAILGGMLLLPERTSVDLPLLPALTKHSIPALSVLLMLGLYRTQPHDGPTLPLLPRNWIVRTATLGLILGAFATVLKNADMLRYGDFTVLQAMRLYDGFSQVLGMIIFLLPMLLARKFLARPETHVLLLKILCFSALAYSLPALFEVRMSPQLHSWVYGFFPHSFAQQARGGGWRPVVFMEHGLVVALFFSLTVLATAGLWRVDHRHRALYGAALVWLLGTLVLCKSLGALIIATLLLPAILFFGVRRQLIVATIIAAVIMVFPVARSAGLVPTGKILELAQDINPARAESFAVRIENEDRLLRKASERPLFGWGGWGRSRVYDTASGQDVTIADGYWVIILGVGGWVRYLLEFSLLCVPIGLLLWCHRQYAIGMETSVLALVLAGNLIDLIPNSSNLPITWLLAGALWGRIELGRTEESTDEAADPGAQSRGAMAYRRPVTPQPQENKAATPSEQPARYTRQTVSHNRKKTGRTPPG